MRNPVDELNKLRGRKGWETSETAKRLMKEVYLQEKMSTYGIDECCKLVGVMAGRDEMVTYNGGWDSPNRYVESYKDDIVSYTYDEKNAKFFFDEVEATKCMRDMLRGGMTHILVWYYNKAGSNTCQTIQYPNEHWSRNFQPVLLKTSVAEYQDNPY